MSILRFTVNFLQKSVYETTEYLEKFLRNLLLNEKNELHNRDLHISGFFNLDRMDIREKKTDIESSKMDIREKKVDIEKILSEKDQKFSTKMSGRVQKLFEKFGFEEVFGRSVVMELLEIKESAASKFLATLLEAEIIEPVSGYGKGKYKFKKYLR